MNKADLITKLQRALERGDINLATDFEAAGHAYELKKLLEAKLDEAQVKWMGPRGEESPAHLRLAE